MKRMIADTSSAEKLTVMVGAGASMEAGLPGWETLVERLVVQAGRESGLAFGDDDPMSESKWVSEVSRDGPLGAAAIVDALVGSKRDKLLRRELFGEKKGPANYLPGETSIQLARLYEAFGSKLRILTTNYDDLIEQAFRQVGKFKPLAIATDNHLCGPNQVEIFHLHGYLGRDKRPRGQLILSEGDYQAMQRGNCWQEQLVSNSMRDSVLLFIGSSLVDPNMLRYLHHGDSTGEIPKYAVFVRQGTYGKDVNPEVIKARELALVARWKAVGVVPIFLDHYQDVAQLIHEIGKARREGDSYIPLPERGKRWVKRVERDLLQFRSSKFTTAQRLIVEQFSTALESAISAAEELEQRKWQETVAMSMWLVDASGEHLTNWVTTDRLHLDPKTVEPVRIDEHAKWVAVRTFCRGISMAEERDVYASRWHFIRSIPLVIEKSPLGRLPVGCLTIATMASGRDSMLNVMEDVVEKKFNRAMRDSALDLLELPFA